jgi:hypothetical protein
MGKLAVQKYFSFTILLITVLLMVFTLVGLFGGDVNPAGNTARAMLVYALPILIAGNVVFHLLDHHAQMALDAVSAAHPAVLYPLRGHTLPDRFGRRGRR